MKIFHLEYSALEKGTQRPFVQRWVQNFFLNSDSDSPDDEESKSIIRISVAQSSAKLAVLQRIRYF